ncbi:MAG: aminoacyl-tRNA hydrolase [Anaerolineales bacterium]|nr:aminoacyl-tRNA hydrolase [Anaerolineales bacterium]
MDVIMSEKNRPYLIVGLGNPGPEYHHNRHNLGFMVLDRLAEELGVSFSKMKMEAFFTRARYKGRRVILAKPQTYMNQSGRAVRSLLRFYKIPLERLLVVYDDVDLPLDSLRLRPNGSAGGQKGVKSVIEKLGTKEFARLRVGVGRPPGRMTVSSYVLKDFSPEERDVLPFILGDAVQAVLTFIVEGIHQAMTQYNRTST